jgi:hypothetical protein
MSRDRRLDDYVRNAVNAIERSGYWATRCSKVNGNLGKFFDIIMLSRYSEEKPTLIKIEIETISRRSYKRVLDFKGNARKEIWLNKKLNPEKDTSPGKYHIYKFEGEKLIYRPPGYPIKKNLSRGTKVEAGSEKSIT